MRRAQPAPEKALQSALDIVLLRFAEYHNLESAFGRRATTNALKASSWPSTPSTNKKRSTGSAYPAWSRTQKPTHWANVLSGSNGIRTLGLPR
jgi:hypothetical protein